MISKRGGGTKEVQMQGFVKAQSPNLQQTLDTALANAKRQHPGHHQA
jgi:hypothetical protein